MNKINGFKKYIIYIFIVISTITVLLYLGLGYIGIKQGNYSGFASYEDSITLENKDSSRIISNKYDQVEIGEIVKVYDLPQIEPEGNRYDAYHYYQSSVVDEKKELVGVGGFGKIYWFDYELNLVDTWDYTDGDLDPDLIWGEYDGNFYDDKFMISAIYPDWENKTIYCATTSGVLFSVNSETGEIINISDYPKNIGVPIKIIELNHDMIPELNHDDDMIAIIYSDPLYYDGIFESTYFSFALYDKRDLSFLDEVLVDPSETYRKDVIISDYAWIGNRIIYLYSYLNTDDDTKDLPGHEYISGIDAIEVDLRYNSEGTLRLSINNANVFDGVPFIRKATYNIDGEDVEDNIYSAFKFVELEGETKYISLSPSGYAYYWDATTNSVRANFILDKETGQPVKDKSVKPWSGGTDSVKLLFEDDNVAYTFSGADNGNYFFHEFDKNTKQTYLLSNASSQAAEWDWDDIDPEWKGANQSIKSVAEIYKKEGKIISIGKEGGVALLSAIDKESFDIQMVKPEEYIDGYNPYEYQLIIKTKYGLELDENSTEAGITVYDTSKVDETSGEPTEKIDISFSEMEFISTEEEESNGKYIIEFSVEDIFEPGTEFAINSINIKDWVSFEDYNYYDLNGEYVESGNIKYTTAKSTMSISKIEPTSINVSVQYPTDYSMLKPEGITFYNEVNSPTPGFKKLEAEFISESGLPTVTPEGNYNYDFIITDLVPDTEYKIYYSFYGGANYYIYPGSEITTSKLPLLFNEEAIIEQEGSNITLTFSIVNEPGTYSFNEDNVYLVNEINEWDRIKGVKVLDSSKSSTEYKYKFENIDNKTYSLRVYNDDGVEITNPEDRVIVIGNIPPESMPAWLIVMIIITFIIFVSGIILLAIGIFLTTKTTISKKNESK